MKLIFATHNVDKFMEVKAMIPQSIELLSLNEIACLDEIDETGKTLEENAIIKAKYVNQKYGCNCFADDTGLEVDSLDGDPGVFSARYAGSNVTYKDNVEKLLNKMIGLDNRIARFRTVISLILNDQQYIFEGLVKGTITNQIRGENGFGYDSVFLPGGSNKTFAEMQLDEKNKISHRAIALFKLVDHLNKIVEM